MNPATVPIVEHLLFDSHGEPFRATGARHIAVASRNSGIHESGSFLLASRHGAVDSWLLIPVSFPPSLKIPAQRRVLLPVGTKPVLLWTRGE